MFELRNIALMSFSFSVTLVLILFWSNFCSYFGTKRRLAFISQKHGPQVAADKVQKQELHAYKPLLHRLYGIGFKKALERFKKEQGGK